MRLCRLSKPVTDDWKLVKHGIDVVIIKLDAKNAQSTAQLWKSHTTRASAVMLLIMKLLSLFVPIHVCWLSCRERWCQDCQVKVSLTTAHDALTEPFKKSHFPVNYSCDVVTAGQGHQRVCISTREFKIFFIHSVQALNKKRSVQGFDFERILKNCQREISELNGFCEKKI